MAKYYNKTELKTFLYGLFTIDGITNARMRRLTKILNNVYCENAMVDIPGLAKFCSAFLSVEVILKDATCELDSIEFVGSDPYCSMWLNRQGLWFKNHYDETIKLIDFTNNHSGGSVKLVDF